MVKTAEEINRHLGILRRRDPRISHAIKTVGFPGPRMMSPGFATLARIIIDQQVSTAAGAAIWAKLRKAAGRVTPARVLALGESGLRSCGLSGQKARYTLGIADATVARKLKFAALAKAEDEAVREVLMAFKGIGVWTADIYLMFGMGRLDVWPVGDLGLQNAVQLLHDLKKRPTHKDMEAVAEPWRPYRTSAAILLWRYYGASRVKNAKN